MPARLCALALIVVLILDLGDLVSGTVAGAQEENAPKPRPGRLYALLVGVREYKTPALRPLKYTERDVEDLGSVLGSCGYDPKNVHLRILTQTRGAEGLRYLPSSDNIRTELARMLKLVEIDADAGTAEDDTIVIALSGHGILDPKTETSYFCPSDTSARNLAADDPALINLGELYDQLKACKAGFKLLLADACRNDPLSPNKSVRPVVDLASVTRPLKKRKPGGVAALFSCSDGQVSYEDDKLKHGVFFHFVIEGLKGEADEKGDRDGKVTLSELANYTSKEVYSYVDRTRNDEQLPEYALKANSIALVDRPRTIRKPALIATRAAGIKLKLIPAGQFLMGSSPDGKDAEDDEKPWHWVRITQPFYLGITEVTRGQFRQFVDDSGYKTEAEKDGKGGWGWNEEKANFEQDPKFTWLNPGFEQTDEHPVVNVSWNDAVAFCQWLSHVEGRTYRLPTEAEWEYACRAGTTTKYFSGDDPETLATVGNVADGTAKEKYPKWSAIAAHDGYIYTAPVARFRVNAFGLYDMHGNVWEWCQDWYDKEYYKRSPVEDPLCAEGATLRVNRGGGWIVDPRVFRSARRLGLAPESRVSFLGFRLARVQSNR